MLITVLFSFMPSVVPPSPTKCLAQAATFVLDERKTQLSQCISVSNNYVRETMSRVIFRLPVGVCECVYIHTYMHIKHTGSFVGLEISYTNEEH